MPLTQRRLKELLAYNPDTGHFTWRVTRCPVCRAGSRAGCINTEGYVLISIDHSRYYAHRVAWLYVHGKFPPHYIDHVNGDKADNRLCNLREATNQQNQGNGKHRTNNTSGYKGVRRCQHLGKWRADIYFDGKPHFLGVFSEAQDAAAAYRKAARERFGAFSKG